jgi:hypothetical protein
MKTIALLAYPIVVLVAWLAVAAWTLSALATVEPSLRYVAAVKSSPASPVETAAAVSISRGNAVGTAAERRSGATARKPAPSARAGIPANGTSPTAPRTEPPARLTLRTVRDTSARRRER